MFGSQDFLPRRGTAPIAWSLGRGACRCLQGHGHLLAQERQLPVWQAPATQEVHLALQPDGGA
eukprot:2644982-Prorocentrum_lima.AAC.1